MKTSDYTILFLALLAVILLPSFFGQSITKAAASRQTQYAQYLTNACQAALAEADMTDRLAFGTEKERENAVAAFFNSIAIGLNSHNTTMQEEIPYYVPVILLIDNDGFYCVYQEYNGAYEQRLTPLIPYAAEFQNKYVRFYLDGRVAVTDSADGITKYFDSRQQAQADFPDLTFFSDDQSFRDEISHTAVTQVKQMAEYYINQHNTYNRVYDASYTFSLPEVSGQDWASLMDGPCVLSFLQGIKTYYPKGHVNIYALSGSRMEKAPVYLMTRNAAGEKTYHLQGCPNAGGAEAIYYSMQEAAMDGAWPCTECIR